MPYDQRATTTVAEVAVPLAAVPTATPDQSLTDLLGRASLTTGGRTLVLEADRLVGIVTPTDIARAMEINSLAPAGPRR